MEEYEKELIKMIREHEHPEKALAAAITIISDFLTQRGSSQEPSVVDPQEPF